MGATEPADERPLVSERRRVAHVFGAMDIGGAESRTIELMEALTLDVDAFYVTLSGRKGVLAPRIEASGGRVVPLALGAQFPVRFCRFLTESDIEVVHSHVHKSSGPVLGLAKTVGIRRRIAHFRSDGDGRAPTWRRRAQRLVAHQLLDWSATKIVGVSPGTLAAAWDPHWEQDPRCVVIPNGITDRPPSARPRIRRTMGIGEDTCVLAHVGRPSPEKNRVRLPGILRDLIATQPSAHLVVVGPRQEEQDRLLIDEAGRSGVLDRVHFLGARDDVLAILQEVDVLLLPSVREGLPGTVLEARLRGVPVVASDLPGVRFIREHLGGVSILPVQAPTGDWAEAVGAALSVGREPMVLARERFVRSPFAMANAVRATRALYGLAASGEQE